MIFFCLLSFLLLLEWINGEWILRKLGGFLLSMVINMVGLSSRDDVLPKMGTSCVGIIYFSDPTNLALKTFRRSNTNPTPTVFKWVLCVIYEHENRLY